MQSPASNPVSRPDRRRVVLGALGAGLVAVSAACSADDGTGATSTSASGAAEGADQSASTTTPATAVAAGTALTAADFEGLGSCVLLPETTAGPFPLEEQFDRSDITEGLPGRPMRLGLRVVDQACAAVPGASVEVWHADATGDYSAFADGGGGKDEAGGTTFLRGTQSANDEGIVEFLTIYPGWYRGRAVHVHLRVHLEDETVLTSQLFFDDDYTAAVYEGDAYVANGLPDTTNARDSIAGDVDTNGTLLHLSDAATANGDGTLALANLGIAAGVGAGSSPV